MLIEPASLPVEIPASDAVPGHKINCWQWNKAGKETVLCVHGLTRNGRDFDFLAAALADEYHVLAPDMPGRGKSGWLADPAGYNYATYVADIAFLLTTMGIRKVHWVGTSMGGIAGMMMGNANPGLLASLVLNDVGALIPATGLKRILNYAGVKTHFATRAEAEAALRERCAPFGITEEAHWQHLFAHSIEATDTGFRLTCDPGVAATFPAADKVADIDLWGLWPALSAAPNLLIRGAQSDILPQEVAFKMKANHPRLTLEEVPGAGHAPALMDQKQTALIRHWINAV